MTDQIEQPVETVSNTEQTVTALNSTIDTTINIPEKFKVTSEDGTVDYKSTLTKMNESYSYLEKKVGSGEVIPKTEDDYKIEREGFDFNEFKADESNKAFLKSAHAKGITNSQLDFLLSEYDARAVDLVSNSSQISTDDVVNTLQQEWGTSYQDNMLSAIKAAKSAGITQEQLSDPSIGNNISFIKLASYFGSQMTEDKPVQMGTPVSTDIQSLMRSEAFFDTKHPEHKAVKAQIDSYYNSLRKK